MSPCAIVALANHRESHVDATPCMYAPRCRDCPRARTVHTTCSHHDYHTSRAAVSHHHCVHHRSAYSNAMDVCGTRPISQSSHRCVAHAAHVPTCHPYEIHMVCPRAAPMCMSTVHFLCTQHAVTVTTLPITSPQCPHRSVSDHPCDTITRASHVCDALPPTCVMHSLP